MTDQNQCCERAYGSRAFLFGHTPGTPRLCWHHMSEGQRRLIHHLDDQAASVGVKNGQWPYGPNVDLDARNELVTWAQKNRLQLRQPTRCLHWLLNGRCNTQQCWGGYGFGDLAPCGIALTSGWLDHVTTWVRDGRPAAFVAQPYLLNDNDRRALRTLGTKPGLRVEIDENGGWYGRGTVWIAIWREGEIRIPDPSPVCRECRKRRGSWFVHRPTLDWYCLDCFGRIAGRDTEVEWIGDWTPCTSTDRQTNVEWLRGHRRNLIKWMRMASFLYDALPAIDPEEES